MIHIEDKNNKIILSEFIHEVTKCHTLKEKTDVAVKYAKAMPIRGCITGSCLLNEFDPDLWSTTPDVDVFVYTEDDLVKACTLAEHVMSMTPGMGTERSEKQERWKLDRLWKNGLNMKIGITTYKFYCNGVILNFTYKQKKVQGRWVPITTCTDVLASFDMSIIMRGFDIQSRVMFDLRPDNVPTTTAIPNPLRDHDCVMWTVSKWVRQFDRVVKYYDRGYDTRPMAKFYLDMIDECIKTGCLFDSDESHELFDQFSEEFLEKRAQIADWYDTHKNDGTKEED